MQMATDENTAENGWTNTAAICQLAPGREESKADNVDGTLTGSVVASSGTTRIVECNVVRRSAGLTG